MCNDVFTLLNKEWETMAIRPSSCRQLRQWAEAEPALCGYADLVDLVGRAQSRGAYDTSDSILLALATLAPHDPLAARVLLQALLPGLRTIARRRRGLADHDDVAAAVIAAAWEQVCRYPTERRPRRVAANLLYDTRQRIDRKRGEWQDPNHDELPDIERLPMVPTEPGASELLGRALVEGVEEGTIKANDARIIWLTRCLGVPTRTVADQLGLDERNARQRRSRAERRLRSKSVESGVSSGRRQEDLVATGDAVLRARTA